MKQCSAWYKGYVCWSMPSVQLQRLLWGNRYNGESHPGRVRCPQATQKCSEMSAAMHKKTNYTRLPVTKPNYNRQHQVKTLGFMTSATGQVASHHQISRWQQRQTKPKQNYDTLCNKYTCSLFPCLVGLCACGWFGFGVLGKVDPTVQPPEPCPANVQLSFTFLEPVLHIRRIPYSSLHEHL